jgi:hypothetical protein
MPIVRDSTPLDSKKGLEDNLLVRFWTLIGLASSLSVRSTDGDTGESSRFRF